MLPQGLEKEVNRRRRMMKHNLSVVLLIFCAGLVHTGCARFPLDDARTPPAHFTLWQLPSQTQGQMNSYVLQTGHGEVMVIDGGNRGDAPYLKGFLGALGNHVHAWFISHPHPDHIDALTAILEDLHTGKLRNLVIDSIYGSMLPEEEVAKYETWSPVLLESVQNFNQIMRQINRQVREHHLGEVIEIDGVHIEILGIKNPEITGNFLNNSSVVMRVTDAGKSVLFTGDLGTQGGQKLLASRFRDRLRADYVQMAHHGQRGVDEAFYQAVMPKYCLWPTPRWLWENDKGEGKGSGDWDTLNVRAWMNKLEAHRHYVSADGLYRIE